MQNTLLNGRSNSPQALNLPYSSQSMKPQRTDPRKEWQGFITSLHELRTEMCQELARLRTKRAEALMDFAISNAPTDRASLDALTEQVTVKTETLADVGATIAEAEREIPSGSEGPRRERASRQSEGIRHAKHHLVH